MSRVVDNFDTESESSEECINEATSLAGNAAELIDGLRGAYLEYAQKNRIENTKRGFSRLFEKWFNLDPLAIKPLHQEFLDNVGHFVAKLVLVLKRMDIITPEICRDYAGKALDIMFAPKPDKAKTDADRYFTIAEYESVPLFSYASSEDLQCTRDKLLKRTPKRFMFPKQLEMLEFMDNKIAEKTK